MNIRISVVPATGAQVEMTRYYGDPDCRIAYNATVRATDADEIGPCCFEWTVDGGTTWHQTAKAARLAATPRYTVQQHGEWSGRDDVLDLDFEAADEAELARIIRDEIPTGVIYIVVDNHNDTSDERVKA